MPSTPPTPSSTAERIWSELGLVTQTSVSAYETFLAERLLLQQRTEILKGWIAWRLKDCQAAIRAFRAAVDLETLDDPLGQWLVGHLVEQQADYLEPPTNGAWPARSLCPDESRHSSIVERLLPERRENALYGESTLAALELLHRLLLTQPSLMPRAASLYHAYHAVVEPVTGMVLAPIVAGDFLMGSPESEPERASWEGPRHRVTLTSNFWIGIYPVTQQQYLTVTDKNPSEFPGDNRPVEQVDWEMAGAYCAHLTERAKSYGILPPGYEFRLPTEAEWEYCCRAGTTTATAFGDGLSSQQANFDGTHPYGKARKGKYLTRTSDVGSYQPNAWGLYDMHGNVWEWCLDAAKWDSAVKTDTYVDGIADPLCRVGRDRVVRGGSWFSDGRNCRSACRRAYEPGHRNDNLGFRVCLARSPAGPEANRQQAGGAASDG
ncbi:MAG: formylglycine-generating enzyme family protein [Pirellulaceae bacterium]|nr:formylglycine-generating enzyme family protein [Pirellulaceae bacterium]